MKTDTIAAIATSLTESGIGIIRVSGDESIDIVHKLFFNKYGKQRLCDKLSHTVNYGFIVEPLYLEHSSNDWKNNIIDEVMVTLMKSPNSYTTEDIVEISCHGGILMMQRILELILKNGARIAEPGEFTKRAFLNGRIDLSKAEAVIDIIHSKNQYALTSSVNQLKGTLSDKIKELREKIIYEIAFIESALDDPEHISLDGYEEELLVKVINILKELEKLIQSADNGKLVKEGINTVILGKPNAGKSSLLNRLLGEDRAIVTEIAGTTRDVLQESIKLHGIGLNVIDTAGIRQTEDIVEKIGVNKAKEFASKADLIIYVVDASVELDESDKEIISFIKDKKVIILLNKVDLESVVNEEIILESFENLSDTYIIKTSTKENTGIDIFENQIKKMFFDGELKFNDEVIITNMRHKNAIEESFESIHMVKRSLENHMPEDFYSIDLMSAYSSLGTIIGEEVGEDLVNEIFSKFCMGK